MAKTKLDWSVLKSAGMTFAGAMLFSVLVAGGGYYFKEQQQSSFTKEQRAFLSVSRRYLEVDEEEKLIQVYSPRYQALEDRGVIGEERRLNWTESLRNISNRLRLPSLRYDIAPQVEYETAYRVNAGPFRLYASRMRLDLSLLHEEDLFRLFRELEMEALGQFSVESCTLRRVGGKRLNDPTRANLNASCELLWMTLRKPV
ncbi:MAG: hypothetical protein GY731_05500 [Gammaproteobacteria bacterium]|nr:hypothetical protein [Gammaproteobacteria bacterium]